MISLRELFNLPYRLHSHNEGSGPTIVLLHGIASSSANWQYLVPLLAKDYRCITIDLLGFGDSPKPARSNYTIDDHIRSLRRTIKSLGIANEYILVGHSLGALLASRYARQHPRGIKRLILLSPPIYLPDSQINRLLSRNVSAGYSVLYKFLRTHKKFTLRNAKLISRLLPSNILTITEETWRPFVKTLENCIEKQTAVTDIAEVSCPIDIFYGKLDQFIIQRNLQIIRSMRHIETHELPFSDHVVRGKYAKAVANLLNTSDHVDK